MGDSERVHPFKSKAEPYTIVNSLILSRESFTNQIDSTYGASVTDRWYSYNKVPQIMFWIGTSKKSQTLFQLKRASIVEEYHFHDHE